MVIGTLAQALDKILLVGILLNTLNGFGTETVSVQKEQLRLESLLQKKTIRPQERQRLAEIYFLTSRCKDVSLLGTQTLLCACGFSCAPNSSGEKILQIRKWAEDKGAVFTDSQFQIVFRSVEHEPEARYWLLKLMNRFDPHRYRSLQVELNKSLESLEVK